MLCFRSSAIFFLGGVFSISTSYAQTSIYGLAGAANYGFTQPQSNNFNFKGDTGALGGGAFYNFPIDSRVTVGVDGRALYSPGQKGGSHGGVALRVGFVPHRYALRPYFQLGGGFVHSSFNEIVYSYDRPGVATVVSTRRSVTSGAAQFLFGLDTRLTDRLDLRLPEFGAQAGGSDGLKAGTGFFNAGLVYHLRSR